jgi:transcriptional regulator with XRE-family HTH domain
LTYENLAERAEMSRSTVWNYLTVGHRRKTRTLERLLDALGASPSDRDRALQLHRRRILVNGADPAEVGWSARAQLANCTVWTMAQFTASQAGVHTAIGRHRTYPLGHLDRDQTPPGYVPRAHDDALRRDIAAATTRQLHALIVMRGTSSTGKTRSLFEAVHALCPDWTVIRPRGAEAMRQLPESGLLNRPCVVWLNELQNFLGPNGSGLSREVLRDLYAVATRPVVLVGTLWPDKQATATADRDERTSQTRELLTPPWVRWHEVPPTLTTGTERAAAEN